MDKLVGKVVDFVEDKFMNQRSRVGATAARVAFLHDTLGYSDQTIAGMLTDKSSSNKYTAKGVATIRMLHQDCEKKPLISQNEVKALVKMDAQENCVEDEACLVAPTC